MAGRAKTIGCLLSFALSLVAFALAACIPNQASAADICNAVALVDVPDWGDGVPADAGGSVLKRGQIDEAVTQYRVNRKTGDAVFCSHGGYCYPRYIKKGGQRIEALRLTNCKIGAAEPSDPAIDGDDIFYDISVDRSKNSKETLRYDDIDNALLNIGMCSACASNAADLYINQPESSCGSLVANALAGDKAAIAELQGNPRYCEESAVEPVQDSAPQPSAVATDDPGSPKPAPDVISYVKVALAVAAIFYFLPSVIAFTRRKRNAKAILALNLFMGWTFLGWVGALIWALLNDASVEKSSG